ncbi:hypothetical protein VTN77DRAFT_4968 [Rasamsonia byssochlamydoides]|uniref:uncharacterized protein n=1 Tax=Rasamsonia byssochlamydoides TaxID=89139 RepID=UPI003742E9DA
MACFIQLRDNVPTWIAQTNGLMAHVHAKRAEFAEESSSLLSRKRKAPDSASSRSRRTLRPDEIKASESLHKRSRTKGEPLYLSAGSKRQKVENASWTDITHYSTRKNAQLVVSYDGHTQKVLEEMVRQICSAKSNIRAARMSQSMRVAFKGRSPMQLSTNCGDGPAMEEETTAADESRRGRTKESPLDFLEGQLDAAQSLCESGAYRFLREGDCLDELDGIVQAFEMILEASTTMAEQTEERMQGEKEGEEEKQAANEETGRGREPPLTGGANDPSKSQDTILEVDDNSSRSSVAIDISAFRLNRYGQRTVPSFAVSHHPR